VSVAGFEHPGAVRLVAPVQQGHAACQRRAAVRPPANLQFQPRAAAFQCAVTNLACHDRVPCPAMCRDDVCVCRRRRVASYGDSSRPINGLEIPRGSLQFHMHHYFSLRRGCRSVSAHLYARVRQMRVFLAHETTGAACTRHSLLPLLRGGTTRLENSGKSCRENTFRCPRERRDPYAAAGVVRTPCWRRDDGEQEQPLSPSKMIRNQNKPADLPALSYARCNQNHLE
jgi:hypothetical protein